GGAGGWGTMQAAWGRTLQAMPTISAVAAISRLSGFKMRAFSRAMSSSRMWRRSSRKCAVMPSAPAAIAISAALTGSGCRPPRAFRTVATWSTLTPRRSRERAGTSDPICASMETSDLARHALGFRDHGLGAQLRDDRGEVFQVIDLEVDGQRGEVRRLARHADVVDVSVVLGDHLGDLRQRARLVDRLHGNACGEA